METANITLKIDKAVLREAKHVAVDSGLSLSAWVAQLIKVQVSNKSVQNKIKKRAIKRLEKGYNLGGKPLSRAEIYND